MWRVNVRIAAAIVVASLGVGGCTTVDPSPDLARTSALIEASTGRAAALDLDRPLPDRDEVAAVLTEGLDPDEAVDVALRNNRHLQAAMMEVAIGRADLVQAGLLTNPSFGLEAMFPAGGRAMLEGSLLLTLSELWQIDARKRAAASELEQRILETARQAGELVANVRVAHAEAVAARDEARLAAEREAIAQHVVDAIRRLHESGLVSPREVNDALQAQLAAQADREVMRRRSAEALANLGRALSIDEELRGDMLVSGPAYDALPDMAAADTKDLIAFAREHRLDLRALAEAEASASERAAFERSKAIGDVRAGPMHTRAGSDDQSDRTGFVLQWMVPIFDQNQAQVARADYERARRMSLAEARFIEIAQSVRTAAEDVRAAKSRLDLFLNELVPAAARGVEHAQAAYEAGESTLLDVLDAEQRVVDARQNAVRAQADHDAAMARLELAVGAPLTSRSLASRIH